jgi:hypothetical protein
MHYASGCSASDSTRINAQAGPPVRFRVEIDGANPCALDILSGIARETDDLGNAVFGRSSPKFNASAYSLIHKS